MLSMAFRLASECTTRAQVHRITQPEQLARYAHCLLPSTQNMNSHFLSINAQKERKLVQGARAQQCAWISEILISNHAILPCACMYHACNSCIRRPPLHERSCYAQGFCSSDRVICPHKGAVPGVAEKVGVVGMMSATSRTIYPYGGVVMNTGVGAVCAAFCARDFNVRLWSWWRRTFARRRSPFRWQRWPTPPPCGAPDPPCRTGVRASQ